MDRIIFLWPNGYEAKAVSKNQFQPESYYEQTDRQKFFRYCNRCSIICGSKHERLGTANICQCQWASFGFGYI